MTQTGSLSVDTAGAGTRVFTPDGELDGWGIRELDARLVEVLEAGESNVVVDMRGVTFIDSIALETLLREMKLTTARGGGFVLVRPNPTVWKAFQIVGFERRFTSVESLKAALAALGSGY
jgi:anti-sigma B factor antagonist